MRLDSGRIVGPLGLTEIYALIRKGHIRGVEQACEEASSEWKDINEFPMIAEGLLAMSQGRIAFLKNAAGAEGFGGDYAPTIVLSSATEPQTKSKSGSKPKSKPKSKPELIQPLPGSGKRVQLPDRALSSPSIKAPSPKESPGDKHDDKTQVSGLLGEDSSELTDAGTEAGTDCNESGAANTGSLSLRKRIERAVRKAPPLALEAPTSPFTAPTLSATDLPLDGRRKGMITHLISNEQTVLLSGARRRWIRFGKWNFALTEFVRASAIAILLGLFGYEVFLEDTPEAEKQLAIPAAPVLIRPRMPNFSEKAPNPQESTELYQKAVGFHALDHVAGYGKAVELLMRSIARDPGNVKAIAMLASSYLNLIDASSKDEEYFSIISKLIEMTKAKSVDLPETVLAEVEFFLVANKPEAAQERIVEYTKRHPQWGMEIFYYLALSLYEKGYYAEASRFVSQIEDAKAYSSRIFYLRGQIAEKLGDLGAAESQYRIGIARNADHARSRLALAERLIANQRFDEVQTHLGILLRKPSLLTPRELGRSYYLRSQFYQRDGKYELALSDIERAVRLEKGNHDYMLELYQLRAKTGESVAKVRGDARMYYFLSEGEKAATAGNTQQAIEFFLNARQAKERSYLPFAKMGDMFLRKHDLVNARYNFQAAAERAPNNIEVWSKYIDVLIQSYEWEEAQAAMDRFRKLPVGQGAIDKAAGDMYIKQGRFVEGQFFYRKAMARESVDPGVYLAYAQSLEATKNFKDAPFFYALVLRSDPRQLDAITGTARSIAATESIDRAIAMLLEVIEKDRAPKAEILSAIAGFELERGAVEKAEKIVAQAIAISPEAAAPWRLKALIALSREGLDKKALDQALEAFQSYSERNLSDPSGYLERYKIFIKKFSFERASEELTRIYEIYPKYPNLHYYKGLLYSASGNRRAAVEELRAETTNNPMNASAWIALGKELCEAGVYQEALNAFAKAMGLAPAAAEPKVWMGYANYLLKNYAGAIALYKAALSIDKANSMVYKRLGIAYRDSGDSINAAQSFRRYLEIEPDAPDRAEFERYR